MIPQQWASPCGNQCTHKYAALTQIPWRVFCKKGCDSDGETWEECLGECNEICHKDPVLKDQQWSAYIDRSPGAASYSKKEVNGAKAGEQKRLHKYGWGNILRPIDQWFAYEKEQRKLKKEECFKACVAGCGYKYEIPLAKVDQVHPTRPAKPPPEKKPPPPTVEAGLPSESSTSTEDILSASA